MADIKNVVSSSETGLGLPISVLGIFFFVQSYGYSMGAGLEPPDSVAEAVVHGMSHLSHLVTPWAAVAWPLTPSLCAVMLLYCAVLPDQLAAGVGNDGVGKQNRRFLALALLVVFAAVFSGWALGSGFAETWAELRAERAILPPLLYVSIMGVGFLLLDGGLRLAFLRWGDRKAPEAPWPLLISVCAIGLLYMVAFIGSQLDGRIDCLTGQVCP